VEAGVRYRAPRHDVPAFLFEYSIQMCGMP
jgi:hypothetical protein